MGKIKDALTKPMVKTESGRSGLMAVAGGYVVYMAYDMLRSLQAEQTEAGLAEYLAAGALALGGIAILVYAGRRWFAAYKLQQEQQALEQAEQEE